LRRRRAHELAGAPRDTLGFLQGLTTHGLRVLDDSALVGYDDIDLTAAAAVPSVRQPREQLGRTAARLLLEESAGNGRHEHQRVLFRPELAVRRSNGRPAAR
jgi:DNA-binding LacI/PurR family transcriptional regulator